MRYPLPYPKFGIIRVWGIFWGNSSVCNNI